MTEDARHHRNIDRLLLCNVWMQAQVGLLLERLEARGFRPRIQDSWRNPVDQSAAIARGASTVRWSFHMAVTPFGSPDALACDILDDTYPVPADDQKEWPDSFRAYLLWMAKLAAPLRLHTGIAWGLGSDEREVLAAALDLPKSSARLIAFITARPDRAALITALEADDPSCYAGEIGWDPTHVEPLDLTLASARRGLRPMRAGDLGVNA